MLKSFILRAPDLMEATVVLSYILLLQSQMTADFLIHSTWPWRESNPGTNAMLNNHVSTQWHCVIFQNLFYFLNFVEKTGGGVARQTTTTRSKNRHFRLNRVWLLLKMKFVWQLFDWSATFCIQIQINKKYLHFGDAIFYHLLGFFV